MTSNPINQLYNVLASIQKGEEKDLPSADKLIQKAFRQLNVSELDKKELKNLRNRLKKTKKSLKGKETEQFQRTLSSLEKQLVPVPKAMQKAFQEAEKSGGLSASEMEKAYRFALSQLPVKEDQHIRKEQSGLKNALRIIPGKKQRDISVVVFDNESEPLFGGVKIIRQAYGFFPFRPNKGVADLIKGTPIKTRKNSTVSPKRANWDVGQLQKEIKRIKEFGKDRPRGLVYKVWGSTLIYPVKGRKDQMKTSMIMDRAFGDLFQLMQITNINSAFSGFAEDILLGVQYLHEKGLAHRDIKTENILVFQISDEKYELRLTDFESVIEDKTPFKKIYGGTWEYISPEALESLLLERKLHQVTEGNFENLDRLKALSSKPRDIFSVGIVFHEMFTGRLPNFHYYIENKIIDPDTGKIVDYVDPKTGGKGSYVKIKEVENKLHDLQNDYALPAHIEDIKKWHEEFDSKKDFLPEGCQSFDDLDEDKKLKVLLIGELVRDMCHWDPEKRLTIDDVIKRFDEIYYGDD